MAKNMEIGFNTFDGHVRDHSMDCDGLVKKCGGVDFILCHFGLEKQTLDEQVARAEETVAGLKALGAPYVMNFETQNFVYDVNTTDGYDWASHEEGVHRLNVPARIIDAFKKGDLIAVMYDEFEHCIINRNLSVYLASKLKTDVPVFTPAYTDRMRVQGETLSSQIGEYVRQLKDRGAPAVAGEHVFPVLYHTFARNGIIPNYKSQKECYTNVQFAIAAGAALEYEMPLWTCVDLWFMNTFPGHSAEEMYYNLVFSYLMGVDRAYVEASNAFVKKENGEEKFNDYGENFAWFVSQYRGKDRGYNAQDYKPEIGIIRYDDTFWGQGTTPVVWRNELFGNPNVKPKKENKEWIKIFRLITHGETGRGGLAWDRIEPRSVLKKHRSFVSMNGAVVFDDRVPAEKLKTLKLCFLCGEYISDETLKGVKQMVHDNGMIAVTPKRFAPAALRHTVHSAYREVPDGKGAWIICENPEDPRLKKRIAPMLGNKDEMKFTFGDKTVRLVILPGGDSFMEI